MTQSERPEYPGLTPGDQYANPNAMGGKVGSFAPTGQLITRDAEGRAHCPSCGASDFSYGATLLRKYWRLSILGRMLVKAERQKPKPRSAVVCNQCGAKCVWDTMPV